MVLLKNGEMLYNGVKKLVAENLDKLAKEEIVPVFPAGGSDPVQQSQEAEMLLKALRHIWDDHLANMLKLSQILKYMVRQLQNRMAAS
jgi:cullin 3